MPVSFRSLSLPADVGGGAYLHSMPGYYDRWADCAAEIERMAISGIVCLTSRHEVSYKSPDYHAALDGAFASTLHLFGIEEFDIPDDEVAFARFIHSMAEKVRGGERLLIHCAGGIGRTGIFSICLLVVMGADFKSAEASARMAGAYPESKIQMDFVEELLPRLGDFASG